MRLLTYSNNELSVTRDLAESEVKPYAILSHTWGKDEEEVTLHEIGLSASQQKPGYGKIEFCGQQARQDGWQYFWVDTCCIDKANHTELSRAITSMYRWYEQAQVCYVYLADVPYRSTPILQDWHSSFRRSRWFTRGWTLQELLAPQNVVFYSKEWNRIGTKDELKELLHDITSIPTLALEGQPLSQFPIIERMRWTRGRQTKEKEDEAYSLMGIFGVYMPLIYGEGDNAFRRLQKEIDAQSPEASDANAIRKKLHRILRPKLVIADQARHQLACLADTALWILHDPLYIDWRRAGNAERVLCLRGHPGTGKSVLASALISSFRNEDQYPTVRTELIAYFFCHREWNGPNQAQCVLSTIIFQIAVQDIGSARLIYNLLGLHGLLNETEDFTDLGYDAVWEMLFSPLLRHLDEAVISTFVIVDGLDELDPIAQRAIGDIVRYCQHRQPLTRFLLTTRPDNDFEKLLHQPQTKLIQLTTNMTFHDIEAYIMHRLNSWGCLGSDEILSQVKEVMLSKAQGGFLWVQMMFDAFERAFDKEEVKTILLQVPQSFKTLYNAIFAQMKTKFRTTEMEFIFTAIKWVLFSRQPVNVAFLEAVYTFQQPMLAGTVRAGLRRLCRSIFTGFNEGYIAEITDSAISRTTSFLPSHWPGEVPARQAGEILLMHASLADYLNAIEDSQCLFAIDRAAAERELALLCVGYFAKAVDRPMFFPIGESPMYKISTYHLGVLTAGWNSHGPAPVSLDSFTPAYGEGRYFWDYVGQDLVLLEYSCLHMFSHFDFGTRNPGDLCAFLEVFSRTLCCGPTLRIWCRFGIHLLGQHQPQQRARDALRLLQGLQKTLLAKELFEILILQSEISRSLTEIRSGDLAFEDISAEELSAHSRADGNDSDDRLDQVDKEALNQATIEQFGRIEAMLAAQAYETVLQIYLDLSSIRLHDGEEALPVDLALEDISTTISSDTLTRCAGVSHTGILRGLITVIIASKDYVAYKDVFEIFFHRITASEYLDMAIDLVIAFKDVDHCAKLCSVLLMNQQSLWSQSWRLAEISADLGDRQTALALLEPWDFHGPWVEQAYLLRLKVQTLSSVYDTDRMISAYRDGVKQYQLSYELLQLLYTELYKKHDYEEAIEVLQVARKEPGSILSLQATKLLIKQYQTSQQSTKAIAEAMQLTATHKDLDETYSILWRTLSYLKLPKEDQIRYWTSLTTQPSPQWQPYVYLAYCYFDLQQYEAACEAAQASAKVKAHAAAIYVSGKCLVLRGMEEAALAELDSECEGKYQLANLRVSVLRKLQRWDDVYNYLVPLKRDFLAWNSVLAVNLALAQCELGLYAEAELHVSSSLSETHDKRDQTHLYLLQAIAQIKQRKLTLALTNIQTALQLSQGTEEKLSWSSVAFLVHEFECHRAASICYDLDLRLQPVNTVRKTGQLLVHVGVRCNGCDTNDFEGLRYIRKMVRGRPETQEFDLCESCFRQRTAKHGVAAIVEQTRRQEQQEREGEEEEKEPWGNEDSNNAVDDFLICPSDDPVSVSHIEAVMSALSNPVEW